MRLVTIHPLFGLYWEHLFLCAVMHKMCRDERKCAVMKAGLLMMNHKEIKKYWYVRVEIQV